MALARKQPLLPGLLRPRGAPLAAGDVITVERSGPYLVDRVTGPCTCPLYRDEISSNPAHSNRQTVQHWHCTLLHPRLVGPFYVNQVVATDDPKVLHTVYCDYLGEPTIIRVWKDCDQADDWLDEARQGLPWHGARAHNAEEH